MGGLDNLITGGSRKDSQEALARAGQRFEGLDPLSLEAMKVRLSDAVNAGQMTPEDAETYLLEASAQEQVSTDPRLRQAQMNALAQLEGVAQGGLTVGDRGDLQRIQGEVAAAEKGQRDAILQNAQSRGVAGSGMELASQMMAQQQGANRASQQGFDVAKQAQARALEAMLQSGNLGGSIRSQDFGEQSKLAEARDAISRFNTQNKQAVGMANVDARNAAKLRNVNTAQDIANRNQDTRNQESLYNAGNVKDQFTQRLQKATGQAGVDQAASAAANAEADRKTGMFGNILTAGAMGYGASKQGAAKP
jgi:hypothetical protein